ncbi:hypothetical protein ACFFRR_003622 [Megaselia abdita]
MSSAFNATVTQFYKERKFYPSENIQNSFRSNSNGYREAASKDRSARRKIQKFEKSGLENLTTWEKTEFRKCIDVTRQIKKVMDNFEKVKDDESKMESIESSIERWSVQDGEDDKMSKRKRFSEEETLNEEKKMKQPENSVESDDKLRIFVLNLKEPDAKITPEQWAETEGLIQDAIIEFYDSVEDPPELEFQGLNYDKESRQKVIACGNTFVVTWLMGIINNFPQTEVLLRKAVFHDEVEEYMRPRGSIWVPPPRLSGEKVLRLLTRQNRWLDTTGWVVRKRASSPVGINGNRPGEKFFLMMNKECIPALEERDFVVQLSLAKAVIYLKKFKSEEEKSE